MTRTLEPSCRNLIRLAAFSRVVAVLIFKEENWREKGDLGVFSDSRMGGQTNEWRRMIRLSFIRLAKSLRIRSLQLGVSGAPRTR